MTQGNFLGIVNNPSNTSVSGVWNLYEQYNAKQNGIWITPLSIVTSGLVLNLDAGNAASYPGSGTTWTDLSGNGNNGTLTNSPTFNSGNGGYFSFDGVNDYVINSSTTNLPIGSSSRTIQLFYFPKGNVNNLLQIGNGGGGNQIYLIAHYNYAGQIYLFTDAINGGNNLTISGSQVPTLNVWNHITFGNSGQNWFYYLNGVSQASGTWPSTINTNAQKYLIGNRDDIVDTYMNANIAQALIYNRALSAAEILQNFNATRGRFGI